MGNISQYTNNIQSNFLKNEINELCNSCKNLPTLQSSASTCHLGHRVSDFRVSKLRVSISTGSKTRWKILER